MSADSTHLARLWTRAYRGLLSALFVLGIGLPLLDWGLGLDDTPEVTENRTAAPAPKWPVGVEQWRALPGLLQAYWNDAFGYRRRLIQWHAIARWKLGVSASPNVIIGSRGWLFFAGEKTIEQHRGLRPLSAAELQSWAEQLEARRKWLESRGAHYLFVVTPDKQSVYADQVPERYGPFARTPREQLLEQLRSHTSVKALDLCAPLQAARATADVFHHTDTHWNDYGAFLGYTGIVRALQDWYPQLAPRPRAAFGTSLTKPWNGDLAMMLGGIFDVTTETSEAWRPLTRVAVTDITSSVPRPSATLRYSAYQGANRQRPRVVVFHDSYLLAADERLFPGQALPARMHRPPTPTFRPTQLLAEQFSRSVFTWQYGFDAKLVEDEHPDLVIEEHVERQLIWGPLGAVPPTAP